MSVQPPRRRVVLPVDRGGRGVPFGRRELADRVLSEVRVGARRYALAVGLVIAAYVAREVLLPEAGDKSPFQTFVVAALASSLLGGLGPGLIATVLGAVAAVYSYLPPLGNFEVGDRTDVIRLGLFVLEGSMAAVAGELVRRAIVRERALSRGSRQFRRFLDAASGTRSIASEDETPLVEALTDREIEVVRLLLLGLGNAEVAARLYVSTNTVKTHLTHIYGKLGVRTRTEAVARAIQFGLLADPTEKPSTSPVERAVSDPGAPSNGFR